MSKDLYRKQPLWIGAEFKCESFLKKAARYKQFAKSFMELPAIQLYLSLICKQFPIHILGKKNIITKTFSFGQQTWVKEDRVLFSNDTGFQEVQTCINSTAPL